MWDTLRSELESGSIFSVGVHRNPENVKQNLYYLTSTATSHNFDLAGDW